MIESSTNDLSCFIRRRFGIAEPRPCTMASVCMVVVAQCLHLEAVVSDFGQQSAMLDLIWFHTRRHDVYPNLENEKGVWLVQFIVTTRQEAALETRITSPPKNQKTHQHEPDTTSPGNKARLPREISNVRYILKLGFSVKNAAVRLHACRRQSNNKAEKSTVHVSLALVANTHDAIHDNSLPADLTPWGNAIWILVGC